MSYVSAYKMKKTDCYVKSIEIRFERNWKNLCCEKEYYGNRSSNQKENRQIFVWMLRFRQGRKCLLCLVLPDAAESMTLKCIAGIETPDEGKDCFKRSHFIRF